MKKYYNELFVLTIIGCVLSTLKNIKPSCLIELYRVRTILYWLLSMVGSTLTY